MRDQVQREIEGRDPGNRAEGKAFYNSPAPSRELLPVERKILAVNAGGFFGGNIEDEYCAVHFDTRQLDRLTGFLRQSAREFVTTFDNLLGYAAQHTLAFECGQTAGGTECLHRGGDRGFRVFAARLSHSTDYAAIEGIADLDDVPIFEPTAIDKETVGCDWGDCQFGHFLEPPVAADVFDYRPGLAVAFYRHPET